MNNDLDPPSAEQSEAEAAQPKPTLSEAAGAAPEEFEAEEQRFFSEPPERYEEAAEPEHELGSAVRAAPSVRASSSRAEEKELDPSSMERSEVPTLSARQRQLRRRVAGSMGAMLAFLLLGVVVRKRVEATEQARDAVKPHAPALTAQAATVRASVLSSAAASSAAPSNADRQASAVQTQAPPAASPIDTSGPVAEVDAAALVRSARSLLSAGHTRDGVVAAREAVQKNPLDAEPYILLAAGLQDLGNWGEAREVFADCLRHAKHGASSACQYFARR